MAEEEIRHLANTLTLNQIQKLPEDVRVKVWEVLAEPLGQSVYKQMFARAAEAIQPAS